MTCSCSAPAPVGGQCGSCGDTIVAPGQWHCEAVPQVHIDEFIPYIAPYVSGATDEVIGHAARLALIELGRVAGVFRRTVFIDGAPGQFSYAMAFNDCYTVHKIDRVEAGGVCLLGMTAPPCADPCDSAGPWFAFTPPMLHIGTPPDEVSPGWIEANLTVVPGQDTCQVDKPVYDLHAELVAYGALARLQAMSAEPWGNGGGAMYHGTLWRDGLREAKRDARRGYSDNVVVRKTVLRPKRGMI